jgi:hypothetical protein
MTIDNILQNFTSDVILKKYEKISLKKLAKKITKVPDTINIPIEYLVNKDE